MGSKVCYKYKRYNISRIFEIFFKEKLNLKKIQKYFSNNLNKKFKNFQKHQRETKDISKRHTQSSTINVIIVYFLG